MRRRAGSPGLRRFGSLPGKDDVMQCADCAAPIPQEVGRCPECAPPGATPVSAASAAATAAMGAAGSDAPAACADPGSPVRAGVESRAWIGAGYLFAILGGLIGVGIGGMLLAARVDDDEGRSLRRFGPRTRGHARLILVVGTVVGALVLGLSR